MVLEEKKRIRMIISGRVQGVCFRAYACEEGRRLGLKGWVKNLPNGCVELLAEGAMDKLKKLETFCWKGSPFAKVNEVNIKEEPVQAQELRSFEITY